MGCTHCRNPFFHQLVANKGPPKPKTPPHPHVDTTVSFLAVSQGRLVRVRRGSEYVCVCVCVCDAKGQAGSPSSEPALCVVQGYSSFREIHASFLAPLKLARH